MDLIEKLRAAIDEDERLAKAAAWSVADHTYAPADVDEQKIEACGHWVARGVLGIHKQVTVDDPGWDPKVTDTVWNEVGVHVVRQDPARVLRQIATHRKILDLHRPYEQRQRMAWGEITACSTCGSVDDSPTEWPCATLLALAEAYDLTDGRA